MRLIPGEAADTVPHGLEFCDPLVLVDVVVLLDEVDEDFAVVEALEVIGMERVRWRVGAGGS